MCGAVCLREPGGAGQHRAEAATRPGGTPPRYHFDRVVYRPMTERRPCAWPTCSRAPSTWWSRSCRPTCPRSCRRTRRVASSRSGTRLYLHRHQHQRRERPRRHSTSLGQNRPGAPRLRGNRSTARSSTRWSMTACSRRRMQANPPSSALSTCKELTVPGTARPRPGPGLVARRPGCLCPVPGHADACRTRRTIQQAAEIIQGMAARGRVRR